MLDPGDTELVKPKARFETVEVTPDGEGGGVARRGCAAGRAGRSGRADRGVVGCVGLDAGASLGARSGAGVAGRGGHARRWQRLRQRLGRVPRSGAPVRCEGVGDDDHRVLKSIDERLLAKVLLARAAARARVWDAGARPDTITLNIDATLLSAHSDKEWAAGNYKHGYGFHPLGCWLDETGEALGAILRPGNPGSNQLRITSLCSGWRSLRCPPRTSIGRSLCGRTSAARRTGSPPTAGRRTCSSQSGRS